MTEARRRATTTLVMARAATKDAGAIAELLRSVAETLTERHGKGHWSHVASENGVRRNIDTSIVLVARRRRSLIGTFRLATKKPWAIDTSYFVAVKRPLYLLDMAVEPKAQGQGIGRAMVEEARRIARDYPANSIRLDAYVGEAGAGGFYAKCGFNEVGRVVYRGTGLIYFEWLTESGARDCGDRRGAGAMGGPASKATGRSSGRAIGGPAGPGTEPADRRDTREGSRRVP